MKKNERLFDAFGDIDPKYVDEASVERKMKDKRFSRVKLTALAACLAIIIGTVAFLFAPLSQNSVSRYKKSEYYNVIASLDSIYAKSRVHYKNRFDKLMSSFRATKDDMMNSAPGDMNMGADNDAVPDDFEDIKGEYVETTDNQVAGVIESDIFKRTDKFIYYLFNNTVYVYSINGEDSELLYDVELSMPENLKFVRGDAEMYLSLDGSAITVVLPYVNKDRQNEIALLNLSLDGEKPTQKETVTVKGSYVSSRLVDNEILLVSAFDPAGVNYKKPETFIPSVNNGDGYECIDASDIVISDNLTTDKYTVITTHKQSDATLISSAALLSYSDTVYVSNEAIYVTMGYSDYEESDNKTHRRSMTDITRIAYNDGKLSVGLTYTVEGSVLNQYSLDERDGALRVVTTTSEWTSYMNPSYDGSISALNNGSSASLFCLDIVSGNVIGKVEKFAPLGEEVTSVRFDGDSLYVCTAVVVQFTDPVFFFDLSDMTNITYTDTGYIEGFSSSLINMGDGLLLGIGREDLERDKVETYAEADGEVISLDKYIVYGDVATEYKSYYVNREEGLFGFGAVINNSSSQGYYDRIVYILLRVENGRLLEIISEELNSDINRMRGTLIDGYFYMLGDGEFKVLELTDW